MLSSCPIHVHCVSYLQILCARYHSLFCKKFIIMIYILYPKYVFISFIFQWNCIPGSWGLFLIPFWFDVRSPFNVITSGPGFQGPGFISVKNIYKDVLIIDPTYVYRHIIYIYICIYIYTYIFVYFTHSQVDLVSRVLVSFVYKHIQEGSPRSIPHIYIFMSMYIYI